MFFRKGKPVVLTLAYYECPMLCTLVLNALSKGIKELEWTPGNDFRLITVSIDPEETAALAKAKQERYLESLDKEAIPENSWKFLVGSENQIKKLADAVGFQYFYDGKQDEYAHPAVVFILSDKGMISQIFIRIRISRKVILN